MLVLNMPVADNDDTYMFTVSVVKEERILPKLVLKVHKEERVAEETAADSDEYRKEGHKDRHKKKKKKDKKHKHKHDEVRNINVSTMR